MNVSDLLFELSNDERLSILHALREQPRNVTYLSKILDVRIQQVSRHVKRLSEVDLISRNSDGNYYLTDFGFRTIEQLQGLSFITDFKDYFLYHLADKIPRAYRIRISDLAKSRFHNNILEFLREIETVLKEPSDEICMLVDQFPINNVSLIQTTLKRGTRIKTIEPRNRVINTDLDALIPTASTQIEQRMLDEVYIFLYVSDAKCAVSFPTSTGYNDYTGFISENQEAIDWCKALFEYYWGISQPMVSEPYKKLVRAQMHLGSRQSERVVIQGSNDPFIDAQAVQDAVDNFQEVILKGVFCFGSSKVQVSKSIVIRGEGRIDETPLTRIYKKGWSFPFNEYDSVFEIDGIDSEVLIENINFTDFNGACIYALRGKKLRLKDNKMTLETGFGRGLNHPQYGDIICGIWVEPFKNKVTEFREGLEIAGNFIDFSNAGEQPLYAESPLIDDISFESKRMLHGYYMGIGINIVNSTKKITIEKNNIRNMNARGISIIDDLLGSRILINNNKVFSSLPGSYPFRGTESGVGIYLQKTSDKSVKNSLRINNNDIKLIKPDYTGISVLGFNSDTLFDGTVVKNQITVNEAQACIKTDSRLNIENNKFSGTTFFLLMKTNKGVIDSSTSEEEEKIREHNDARDIKTLDPWWRVVRTKPA